MATDYKIVVVPDTGGTRCMDYNYYLPFIVVHMSIVSWGWPYSYLVDCG